VSIDRLAIGPFLQSVNKTLLLDVRSPSEYNHAHMPGAVSLPLFTDEERKVVGTTYKQQSREQAIKIGLDYFGPKMRLMVEEVEALVANIKKGNENVESNVNIHIYCWRGGMRSAAVAWLLNLYGFKVTVLNGGYKAFRNGVLQTFSKPFSLKVVGGNTGSGKTELLHELKNAGESVIDLEGIASHKGSAFGNIDMPPQPSQEMFENILATELNELEKEGKPIWVEDESQRIGNINIPIAFWNNMRHSPLYFLDIPFDERLIHIVEEYGKLNREGVKEAIIRITKRLGHLEAGKALQFLEEGNMHDCFSILLRYYDKHYLKALYNRENLSSLLNKIPCSGVSTANVQHLISKVKMPL
jgi:tRNA 2-selenouridine synthase